MSTARRRRLPEEPVDVAREWTVYEIGGHCHLGIVFAIAHRTAKVVAATTWPGLDVYPVLSSAFEHQRRRMQERVDRNPWPSAYHEAGHAVGGCGPGRLAFSMPSGLRSSGWPKPWSSIGH